MTVDSGGAGGSRSAGSSGSSSATIAAARAEDPRPVEPAPPTATDLATLQAQLGRPARGVRAIRARCGHGTGHPAVVETEPRLPDGTPFPTLFYLTCPVLASAIGTLESSGVMAAMTVRLADDPALSQAYARAHRSYVEARTAIADVPEIAGVSAGGMPDRVKCLHALVAHTLAVGPGVNPFGDQTLALLGFDPLDPLDQPDALDPPDAPPPGEEPR